MRESRDCSEAVGIFGLREKDERCEYFEVVYVISIEFQT